MDEEKRSDEPKDAAPKNERPESGEKENPGRDMNMADALARREPGGRDAGRDERSQRPDRPARREGRGRRGRRRGGGDQSRDRGRGRRGDPRGRGENRGENRGGGEGRDSGRRGRPGRPQRQPQPPRSGGKPFKREIYVNGSFEETRVAVVENDRLVELLWERRNAQNIVGNIYKGRVENVLPGISSAFINIGFEKNAYLYISDVLGDTRKPIDTLLKKGQEVMVQVAKEAIGTKGAKVTMDVTLPGRYLVFTPFSQAVGISKHISDPVERKRISEIIDSLMREVLDGKGVVVRTEAEGASEDELRREAEYLNRVWKDVEERYGSDETPTMLHVDLDVTHQVARDLLTDEVYVYLLDDKKSYDNVVEFVKSLSPELTNRIRLYDGKTPIFTAFNIEPEIERIRQTKVQLPNGGTIVIQEAESLCAIDVNTGRFTGSKSQEETVTMTNVEAAAEVAHQLRLRNIGGIIVIDFIDMKKQSNRQKVMEALAKAVKRDRAKIRILPITRLGLIEMTRERRRESTVSLMTDECPECQGCGRVLSAESLRIRIQREIRELTQGRPGGHIRLVLHPHLSDVFIDKKSSIEKNVHREVKIAGDAHLQWEDYRIILE